MDKDCRLLDMVWSENLFSRNYHFCACTDSILFVIIYEIRKLCILITAVNWCMLVLYKTRVPLCVPVKKETEKAKMDVIMTR